MFLGHAKSPRSWGFGKCSQREAIMKEIYAGTKKIHKLKGLGPMIGTESKKTLMSMRMEMGFVTQA
jgi:hypothetical protein